MWQTHGDLIAKSQDWPDAEEFAKRTKAIMPPEVRAAIEQDGADGEGPSPEMQALMQQAQQAVEEREAALQQAMQALEQANAAAEQAQQELQAVQAEMPLRENLAALKAQEEAMGDKARIAELEAQLAEERVKSAIQQRDVEVKAYEARTRRLQAMRQKPAGEIGTPGAPQVGEEPDTVDLDDTPQVSPDVMALVQAMMQQTQMLVEAISAPRVGIPERGLDGRITKMVSVQAQEPPQALQ